MLKSILSNRKLAKHFLLLLPCYYFRLNEGHYKNICQHCAKKKFKKHHRYPATNTFLTEACNKQKRHKNSQWTFEKSDCIKVWTIKAGGFSERQLSVFKISNQYTFICVVFQRAWSAEFTAHNFNVFLFLNFYMLFFWMINEHISTYQSWQSST